MTVQRKRIPVRRDFAALSRGRIRLRHATTPRQASRSAGDESGRSACEDCEHSVPAGSASQPTLICRHKADTDLPWQVVKPNGACRNFERSRELVPVDIAAALAEGAKLIPLTQDKFAIVDGEDYERLSKYKWHVINAPRTSYAGRHVKGRVVRMHRQILNGPAHLFVDHRDNNGLNNRRSNLRPCTNTENTHNRRGVRNTSSKYKGVYWSKWHNKFKACITADGKRYYLGYFKSEIAAAKAYDKKAIELFGEFAFLNFPEGF